MNLVLNARDAVEAANGPERRIVVSARRERDGGVHRITS
jgi:hypothetical protein